MDLYLRFLGSVKGEESRCLETVGVKCISLYHGKGCLNSGMRAVLSTASIVGFVYYLEEGVAIKRIGKLTNK